MQVAAGRNVHRDWTCRRKQSWEEPEPPPPAVGQHFGGVPGNSCFRGPFAPSALLNGRTAPPKQSSQVSRLASSFSIPTRSRFKSRRHCCGVVRIRGWLLAYTLSFELAAAHPLTTSYTASKPIRRDYHAVAEATDCRYSAQGGIPGRKCTMLPNADFRAASLSPHPTLDASAKPHQVVASDMLLKLDAATKQDSRSRPPDAWDSSRPVDIQPRLVPLSPAPILLRTGELNAAVAQSRPGRPWITDHYIPRGAFRHVNKQV
ncbi:hypothetical protein Cob_v006021 [Colletotrichum orbiculare MAFF 240422]|uniref:Uncharacterized protein n=1 Tax=Colletotrichum orbiculare (strain 104-T / ATCC 96160 / CBS 514.97 / LARS 414 / MAFF 240422) TaxID=1213857 RepID=A0A484FTH1_COLOR|nr:hypothetical protein Cob_v006021 [Colletotrichum orbiculare MAFF 240422]